MLFLTIEKLTGLIPNARALGTLNLIANLFDNGSHATTVVGSFQVSTTVNILKLNFLNQYSFFNVFFLFKVWLDCFASYNSP